MRNGQNKRMRGRNNNSGGRKSQNPLTRLYESNGPDVKIRGTASHIAEKYIQLARDSQGSGDPVAAENYYQHAEHYFRLIAAAQDQFRQGQPQQQPSYRPDGTAEPRDESFDDDADDNQGHPMMGGSEPSYGNREPQQSYPPRDGQPYPQRDGQHHQHRDHQPHRDHQSHYGRDQQSYPPREQPRPHQPSGGTGADTQADVAGLPSFITGGGQPQPSFQQPHHSQNGHDGQPDRFPLHRRRRRHRGPRGDMGGGSGGSQGGEDFTPGPRPTND